MLSRRYPCLFGQTMMVEDSCFPRFYKLKFSNLLLRFFRFSVGFLKIILDYSKLETTIIANQNYLSFVPLHYITWQNSTNLIGWLNELNQLTHFKSFLNISKPLWVVFCSKQPNSSSFLTYDRKGQKDNTFWAVGLKLRKKTDIVHSVAIYGSSLHQFIENNLLLPIESSCGFS
jgi:hypothetical protein